MLRVLLKSKICAKEFFFGRKKSPSFVFAALVAASLFPSCSASNENPDNSWMLGFWKMTADEDGGPKGTFVEFRANGTYVSYDESCNKFPAIGFHIHDGDIYVTNLIPGKGPVSVIFHPNQERTKLVFTSPRTQNNAVYERATVSHCVSSSGTNS